MNIDPEIPRDPLPRKPERSFEQVLAALKPQLDKLPREQRLLPMPPNAEMLEEVQSYVTSLGLAVPPIPPPVIGVGGEFLDPLKLREGRVGLRRKQRVAAFFYRYPDKVLRAVIVFPREGVDIRKIALAIIWGQVADVPEFIVQTEVVSSSDYFSICTYDLSKLIDVPALERFKHDYQQKLDGELAAVRQHEDALGRQIQLLETEKSTFAEQVEEARCARVEQHNRAEFWKIAAWAAIALLPLAAVLARWLGG